MMLSCINSCSALSMKARASATVAAEAAAAMRGSRNRTRSFIWLFLLSPRVYRNNRNMRVEKGSVEDVPVILEMIRGLAEYEKLADRCVATEDKLRETLFGPRPFAETLLVWE